MVRQNRTAPHIHAHLVAQNLAEVAASHRRGGQRDKISRRIHRVPVNLEVEEEERLVLAVVNLGNPDRPSDRSAEVVFPAARILISERPVSVKSLIGEVFIGGAMEFVCTGFRREVIKSAADLPELGREVTGLKRELLDHIDRRLGHGRGPPDVVLARRILPVHLDAEGVGLKSVYVGPSAAGIIAHTRRKNVEQIRASHRACAAAAPAEVQREIVDPFTAHDGALLGALSLQQRRFGRDGDRFARRSDLQTNVYAIRPRYLNLDTRLSKPLETVCLYGQAVVPGGQRRNRVVPGPCSDSLEFGAVLDICRHHTCAGDNGIRLVPHCARDSAAIVLAV